MQQEKNITKHSRFGIASFIVGVLNLGYFGILIYDSEIFLKPAFRLLPNGSFLAGFIFFPLFYLIIPAIGNAIGLLIATSGLFETDHKRLFAVLGLIMNLIIPIIYLIGFISLISQNQGAV